MRTRLPFLISSSVTEAKTIVFGLTGTGYFDMLAYGKYNDGQLTDYAPTDEEIAKGFAGMPNIE